MDTGSNPALFLFCFQYAGNDKLLYSDIATKTFPLMEKKKGDEEMKIKDIINNPILKSVGKYAGLAVTAVVAVSGALADQKREKEFEDLKKTVADLQNKE